MWSVFGALVDFVHAFAMAAWVVGLPLLFVKRWPRVRLGYAIFAVTFVILSRVSMAFLDECFLTTVSRYFWEKAPAGAASGEWFTVRLAYWVFGMAPSHRAIVIVSEILVLATAVGVVYSIFHRRTLAVVATALLLGGCARQIMLPTPVTTATSPRVKACPFGVPTTRMEAVDVEGGVDVIVTADEKYVQDLRARADNQAKVKGPGWQSGPGHFGKHQVSHDHGLRLWKLATSIPHVDTSSTDAPNGTVIHVTTTDAGRVAELRGRLRDRVTLLTTRSCSF